MGAMQWPSPKRNQRAGAGVDQLEQLAQLHEEIHAITDRIVAFRTALTSQGFSPEVAEAATLHYNSVLMEHLRGVLQAHREQEQAAALVALQLQIQAAAQERQAAA